MRLHVTCLLGFANLSADQFGGEAANSLTYDQVRLCFHDRCFDGTASAALFYRFYRERFDQAGRVRLHGDDSPRRTALGGGLFDGDENAIVDFKFSNSPKVTWWFDHHRARFSRPRTPNNSATSRSAHVLRAGIQVVHEAHCNDRQ